MGDTFRRISPREIGREFSRASKSYRRWAVPQRRAVDKLLSAFGGYLFNKEILDVGAGVGLLTERLLELTPSVSACDISFKSLKENPAPRKVLCNAERLPFKSGSFDWSVSSFALHWCDWKRALPEMERVSREGLLLALPVKGSLEGIGFPFPPPEGVLKLLKPNLYWVEDLEIPFRGRDFLLFFKRTGTGKNPNKLLSAFEILKNPDRVSFYGFKVLFAVKFLK
ncbi:MAG TPA: methyltransferase domain-containing protein [Aquificales bacterium]|nr:methyltransferase domain-containing protein [Aquificales bacterium]